MKFKKIVVAVLMMALVACSGKKEESHEHDTGDAWPEMDAFHELMADCYHPMKDEGTLAPAKEKAADMAASAEKWAGTDLPSRVDNDEMKGRLEKLRTDTKAFSDMVTANASDEELAASLEKLHDVFHEIMETWHKSGKP